MERALRRIGGNQDGLHELVEFLLHVGCEGGLCRQTLDTAEEMGVEKYCPSGFLLGPWV